jgi:primosomal protein N' (replication factor Y) (superfamily II helicase)
MANILSRDRNLDRAVRLINSFAEVLSGLVTTDTRILGPALSPLARLKNEHRYQILIKAKTRQTLKSLLQRCLAQGEKQRIDFSRLQIDIDPIDMM